MEFWVLEVEYNNEEDRKVTKLQATTYRSPGDPNTHAISKPSFYDMLIICTYYLEFFLYLIIKNLCNGRIDPKLLL